MHFHDPSAPRSAPLLGRPVAGGLSDFNGIPVVFGALGGAATMTARRAIAALALGVGVAASVVGCQSIDGTASAPSEQVSAYRAEQSVTRSVQAHAHAVDLCEQAIPSMAAMVREYNAFIAVLNKTHDYAKVRGLDTKAREQLAVGANEIRPKLTDEVPADLAESVREFLTAGASLNNIIGAKQTSQLNDVSAVWTRERQTTIDLCARYIPSVSARPSASPSTSKPAPSARPSSPSSSVPTPPR